MDINTNQYFYSNVSNVTNTDLRQQQDPAAPKVRQQKTEKKEYQTTQDYREYLTKKYESLRAEDYSVQISPGLLSKAKSDEKTAKWLEENLSLIPKGMDSLHSIVTAGGGRVISCEVRIEGYDQINTDVHAVYESDPGTEESRRRREEIRERRKEEQEKEEQRLEERKEEKEYLLSVSSNNMENMTRELQKSNGIRVTEMVRTGFDARA